MLKLDFIIYGQKLIESLYVTCIYVLNHSDIEIVSETNGYIENYWSTSIIEDLHVFPITEAPSVVTPLADLECYVTETLMLTAEIRGQPCPEAHWVIKPFL